METAAEASATTAEASATAAEASATTAAVPAAAPAPAAPEPEAAAPLTLARLVEGEELTACLELAALLPSARPDQVVRFLRARKGNVADARTMLEGHLKWRAETLPVTCDADVVEELEKKKYCFSGEDKDGRKVIVVRSRLMGKHTYSSMEVCEQRFV